MKAIVYNDFGDTNVISFIDVEKPKVDSKSVLIKIKAIAVNQADIKYRKGLMQSRLPVQLPYIPGLDLAGIVEEVGSEVTQFQAGDFVYGGRHGGTYAEYAVLKEENISKAPRNINEVEAVSLVVPVVTSITFLIENAAIKAGQRILIHGISGGTGAVMLQLAKYLGAYVIGTASGKGIKIAKQLGADEVIDYKQDRFENRVKNIDLVIDLVGGETQIKSFSVLKKEGKLYSAVVQPPQAMAKEMQVQALFISSNYSSEKLSYGAKLIEAGILRPQVVAIAPLKDAAKMQKLVSDGQLNGRVVLVNN